MSKLSHSTQTVAKSPFLWGGLAAVGFYALVHGGPLGVPLVKRYFTGHPVEYMETVMFSIGLAALVIKAFDTIAQRAGLRDSLLGTAAEEETGEDSRSPVAPMELVPVAAAGECDGWLARLDQLPARRRTNTTSAACGRRSSTSAIAARPTPWTTS